MNSEPPGAPPPVRKRRRLVTGVLAIVLVVLIAVGGAVALHGRDVATGLIRTAMSRFGIPPDELDVRSVGLDRLVIGAISLPGGPSASSIEIEWSLASLFRGRVTTVRIARLDAEASFAGGAFSIKGLPHGEERSGDLDLPLDRLEISRANIAITGDGMAITAEGDAAVTATDGTLSGRAAFNIVAALREGPPVEVMIRAPDWRLEQADGRTRVILAGADFAVPGHGLAASAIDVRLDLAETASAQVAADIRDSATPGRFAPFALTARAQRDQDVLVLSGQAAAEGGLTATFDGRHDAATGSASLSFHAGPIAFDPGGLQPGDLSPIAGDTLQRVSGVVDIRGALTWRRRSLGGNLTARLQDVGFETGIARVSGLDATLRLASIMPPRTADPQRISGTVQIVGLPPAPLEFRFRLPGNNRLVIDSATLGLAGGTIGVSNLSVATGQPVATAIEIAQVDLGAVLDLAGIDGLNGSGTIAGRIPVRIEPNGLSITAGQLASTGPGVVRYTGAALPDGVSGGQDESSDAVRLLREALADFHYTSLALTLDRAESGEGSLLVSLRGANPAVLDNHPFAINIRLETNFDRLAAVLLEGYAAADSLLRRMRPP